MLPSAVRGHGYGFRARCPTRNPNSPRQCWASNVGTWVLGRRDLGPAESEWDIPWCDWERGQTRNRDTDPTGCGALGAGPRRRDSCWTPHADVHGKSADVVQERTPRSLHLHYVRGLLRLISVRSSSWSRCFCSSRRPCCARSASYRMAAQSGCLLLPLVRWRYRRPSQNLRATSWHSCHSNESHVRRVRGQRHLHSPRALSHGAPPTTASVWHDN